MLKRSLIVMAVLGALVGAAGADTEAEPEKVSLEQQQYDVPDFEMPTAGCSAELPEEILSLADLDKLIELQTQDEEGQSLYAYGSWGSVRWCIICTWTCRWVRC